MNEDEDTSCDSVNSKLPPIKEPANQRRFGSLFPNAVAQALAGAADGMASAFSKGPPPSLFSKGPVTDDNVNYGQKIRSMHSLSDPNTPTDSSNFASLCESHQKAQKGNRASFHVPGHDSTNFDTPDLNPHDDSVPMYHNTADQLDDHHGSGNNYGGTNSRSDGYPNFHDGPSY